MTIEVFAPIVVVSVLAMSFLSAMMVDVSYVRFQRARALSAVPVEEKTGELPLRETA